MDKVEKKQYVNKSYQQFNSLINDIQIGSTPIENSKLDLPELGQFCSSKRKMSKLSVKRFRLSEVSNKTSLDKLEMSNQAVSKQIRKLQKTYSQSK